MSIETGLVCGNGEIRIVEWRGRQGQDDDGSRHVVHCVGNDITEIRHSTQELRQTKEYLENVLEYSPDAIGIVDAQGRFIKLNRSAEILYGYSFEELRGKTAYDLYADRDELDGMLSLLKGQGFVKNYEIDMKKKTALSCLLMYR